MFDSPIDIEFKKGLQHQAKYVAIVVRNAMEEFHSKSLSDEQIKELNPIIRNPIYTALYTTHYYRESANVKAFISQQSSMIPTYWEEPKFIEGFKE